jgi:hypothetical protein
LGLSLSYDIVKAQWWRVEGKYRRREGCGIYSNVTSKRSLKNKKNESTHIGSVALFYGQPGQQPTRGY